MSLTHHIKVVIEVDANASLKKCYAFEYHKVRINEGWLIL